MSNQVEQLAQSGRVKLRAIREYAKGRIVNRDEVVMGILIALIGRLNVFLHGPSGTAKTQLSQLMAHCIEDGYFFDIQFFKGTEAHEFLGPWHPEKYRQGILERITDGYIQEAVVALLDEIDKAGGTTPNALLRILNERSYRVGRKSVKMPLRTAIAGSNALLTDPVLVPFMERFHLRYWVSYSADDDQFERLLRVSQVKPLTDPPTISMAELHALEQVAASLEIENEVYAYMRLLRQAFLKEKKTFADRRWVDVLRGARALAAYMGDGSVQVKHLRVANRILTDSPGDKAGTIVSSVVPDARPRDLLLQIRSELTAVMGRSLSTTDRMNELKRLIEQLPARSSDAEVLNLRRDLIQSMNASSGGVRP